LAKYRAQIGDRQFRVEINGKDGRGSIDGKPAQIDPSWLAGSENNLSLVLDGRSFDLRIEERDDQLVVIHAGRRVACTVVDEHLADLQKLAGLTDKPKGKTVVKSPMPGLVVKVLVAQGDSVEKGGRLLVIEAMKMENEVKAPCDGRVTQIHVTKGDAVTAGKELVVIE
jgi:biotin carboxyl carrier protein